MTPLERRHLRMSVELALGDCASDSSAPSTDENICASRLEWSGSAVLDHCFRMALRHRKPDDRFCICLACLKTESASWMLDRKEIQLRTLRVGHLIWITGDDAEGAFGTNEDLS